MKTLEKCKQRKAKVSQRRKMKKSQTRRNYQGGVIFRKEWLMKKFPLGEYRPPKSWPPG